MAGKVDYKTARTTSDRTAKYKPKRNVGPTKMSGSHEMSKGRKTKMAGSR